MSCSGDFGEGDDVGERLKMVLFVEIMDAVICIGIQREGV